MNEDKQVIILLDIKDYKDKYKVVTHFTYEDGGTASFYTDEEFITFEKGNTIEGFIKTSVQMFLNNFNVKELSVEIEDIETKTVLQSFYSVEGLLE